MYLLCCDSLERRAGLNRNYQRILKVESELLKVVKILLLCRYEQHKKKLAGLGFDDSNEKIIIFLYFHVSCCCPHYAELLNKKIHVPAIAIFMT